MVGQHLPSPNWWGRNSRYKFRFVHLVIYHGPQTYVLHPRVLGLSASCRRRHQSKNYAIWTPIGRVRVELVSKKGSFSCIWWFLGPPDPIHVLFFFKPEFLGVGNRPVKELALYVLWRPSTIGQSGVVTCACLVSADPDPMVV